MAAPTLGRQQAWWWLTASLAIALTFALVVPQSADAEPTVAVGVTPSGLPRAAAVGSPAPTPTETTKPKPATVGPGPKSIYVIATTRDAVSLSWSKTPKATKYTVKYSTDPKVKKKVKTAVSTKNSTVLTKLKPRTMYYVTVTASTKKGKTKASKVRSVRTKEDKPENTHFTPVGLTASSPKKSSIKLRWSSNGSGLRYRVSVSTMSDLSKAKSTYVTGTSVTIKGLTDNTTYYARVRVVDDEKRALSLNSTRIEFATAIAPRPPEPDVPGSDGPATIRVGSYNVVGWETVASRSSHPWSSRRKAVADTVLRQQPDVIGFQEISQVKLVTKGGQMDISQAEDLVSVLGPPYQLANVARFNCANQRSPIGCKSKYRGAANSQKIVFNNDTLRLVDHGSSRTSSVRTAMTQHRYVEWAILKHRETGKEFFFVNVHLDADTKSSTGVVIRNNSAMRVKQVGEILAVIKKANPRRLPTYVVGDFNSHKWISKEAGGNAPYDRMIAAGFVDPLGNTWMSKHGQTTGATVKTRINTEYSSINKWLRVAPKKTWINGIYLDYIWTSESIGVPEWETVVKVDAKGKFIGTIPSDHNMIRATTVIP